MINTCYKHHGAWLGVLATLVGIGGCSSRHPAATYPVSGKVVFADGAPLSTGGIILFKSVATEDQPTFDARGAIEADGTFRLFTFEEGDGAVAGKHQVLVRAKRDAADYLERGIIPQPVIDPRFEHYETSGLEFTVEEGSNEFTVTVERPGPGATGPMRGLGMRQGSSYPTSLATTVLLPNSGRLLRAK